MTKALSYSLIAALVLCSSCSYFKKGGKPSGSDVVARVGSEYLYASDLKKLTRGLNGEDSTEVLRNYAKDWVKKKLLLQKASENISDEDVGITKKVEDYRETLLLYEYEKELINQKMDTTVGETEMNEWYEKVKDDFPLEEEVYRINFIKVKKDAPDLDQARKWILKPKDEEDARKLEGYCKEIASSSSIGEGIWYEKENAIKNFPVSESDMNSLTASKKYKEFKTDEGIWFLRIVEVAKKGTPSPIDMIRDKIVKIIMEKRKLLLLERIYNRIYADGKASKAFDIYVKP